MDIWRQKLETIMKVPDFSAAYRRYLLDAAWYELQQMPADPVGQRRIMDEQDPDRLDSNGNPRSWQVALFEDEFRPGCASLPQTLQCSVSTTHYDIDIPAETYGNTKNITISLGFCLRPPFVGDMDTEYKNLYVLNEKMEKFCRTIAGKAGLKQTPVNHIHPGTFDIQRISSGTYPQNYAMCNFRFNSRDRDKVMNAINTMRAEIGSEVRHEQQAMESLLGKAPATAPSGRAGKHI